MRTILLHLVIACAIHAAGWRAIGVFGPEVVVPADADAQAKLLGLTGRTPSS